jgi:hypothetical protein
MIHIEHDDKDVFKMYKESKECLTQGKHLPVFDLPPEAYAFGRATPKSLLDVDFGFFGTDTVENTLATEDFVRDAGYVDSEDNLIPISYKLNKWGYREQKDMTALENIEGVGDCILVTGNSAAFATGSHEEHGFCRHLEDIIGKPVYNLSINNGGSKSSTRIINSWVNILKPLCCVTHLIWDRTRLEFDDAVQVGNHNYKRVFRKYYKGLDSYGHQKGQILPAEEILNGQMLKMWDQDLDELLKIDKTLNVIWEFGEATKLDANRKIRERYRYLPNVITNPWIMFQESWTDEEKAEYFAGKAARDGLHATSTMYKDCASRVAKILKEKQWIR